MNDPIDILELAYFHRQDPAIPSAKRQRIFAE
jgi:hypothetical protein